MYIKKIILTLLILSCGFLASAQKTTGDNYTYIAQRYEWIAGMFKGLGLPAGNGPAVFHAGQEMRAGALYYDSVGVDSGLYVYSGLAWLKSGLGAYTASQGITLSGNDFQFGYPFGSELPFTNTRVIEIGDQSLHLSKHYSGGFSVEQNAPIYARFVDSMTANEMPQSALSKFGTTWERVLRVTGNYGSNFKVGHRQALWYEFGDTARILSAGGDFGGAVQNILYLSYLPSFTTGRSSIAGGISPYEAPFASLSMLEIPSSNASRHMRVNGWMSINTSYLRMIDQPDTIEHLAFYMTKGLKETAAKVLNTYGLYVENGDGPQEPTGTVNAWSLYSPKAINKLFNAGSTAIGDEVVEVSALIDASSTTKGVIWPRMTTTQKNAIASPATGLTVFDTDLNQYHFYNGAAWAAMEGTTPTLQQVTTAGSTTTDVITANALQAKPSYTSSWVSALSYTGNGITARGSLVLKELSDGTGNSVALEPVNMASDILLFLPEGNTGDTLATKAYARSVGGSGGITTLNTLTAATQTFATGTTGTDFNISSATSTHTFNIPSSSASNRGLLTSADWTTFNSKIGGSLTSGRIPFATAATTLGDDANLVWDNVNKRLGIGVTPSFPMHVAAALTNIGQFESTSGAVNFVLKAATTSNSSAFQFQAGGNTWQIGRGVGTGLDEFVVYHTSAGAARLTISDVGNVAVNNGNLTLSTAGNKLNITTGTNASIGVSAAMTAGTITISTTAVTASSKIFLTHASVGGTQGILSVGTITAGTSFVINSSSATDTGTVNWWIVN